ncbi:MAG: prepilin peptidase [Pseudomonadota bacterium]
MPLPLPVQNALICCVALAAVTDLAYRKIPNALVLTGVVGALLLQWLPAGQSFPLAWLAGLLTGFFVLLPLYLLRGMAAGDVKLMAMVGAFTGPQTALYICFATFLIGGVMALCIVVYRGRLAAAYRNLRTLLSPLLLRALGIPLAPARLAPGQSVGGMPYGLAIALGTLLLLGLSNPPR